MKPTPPPADPKAIRECLTSNLAAEFDREWKFVLDQVKESLNLADIDNLLHKWRHTAYMEMCDPGSYYRMLAKVELILRTGKNPDAVSGEEMRAQIERRLAR